MVYNNSNTIKSTAALIKQTSNALASSLLTSIKNNSNAINAFASPTKRNANNSNAVIALNTILKNDSNTVFGWQETVINNSNTIITQNRLVYNNSNVITYTPQTTLIRTSSNVIISTNPTSLKSFIRFNSNAIIRLLNDTLLINNSKALNNFIVQRIATHSHFASNTTINNFNLYQAGLDVAAGKTLTLNTPLPVNGNISSTTDGFLINAGTLSLRGDLSLGSNAYLTNGGYISGNGYSIQMTDSLVSTARLFMENNQQFIN